MSKVFDKKYLEIVRRIAVTDFRLKYEGSVLGYIWSLVKPLMLFSVLYVVFTQFFKIGDSVKNYPTYLFTGIVLWSFFIDITIMNLGAIVGKQSLIRKIYFPRSILIFATSMTSIMTFGLNFLVLIIFMIGTSVMPSLESIWIVPLLLLELFVFTTGLSLILGALYVKFRDLVHIWEVVLQFLFYATPIIYIPSMVPQQYIKFIMLNPMAQIIQDVRSVLINPATITVRDILSPQYALIPYVIPIFVFIVGVIVFNRAADGFAEEV